MAQPSDTYELSPNTTPKSWAGSAFSFRSSTQSERYPELSSENISSFAPDTQYQSHGPCQRGGVTTSRLPHAFRFKVARLSELWSSMKNIFSKRILRSGSMYDQLPSRLPPSSIERFQFAGWRGGVIASFAGVGICVVIVEVLFFVALLRYPPINGIGNLYSGSCERVKNLSDYALLFLNVLGTITIASSNFVMQVMSAPNRDEVNQAHRKGRYLNIGISSISNLKHLSRRKSIIYFILGLSMVPIHLLLNSLVFASLQANNYGVMVVSQDWMEDPTWDNFQADNDINSTLSTRYTFSMRDQMKQAPANFAKLSTAECVSRYGNSLQSVASNVVLVTNETLVQWANLPSNDNGAVLAVLDFSFDTGNGDAQLTVEPNRFSKSTSSGLFLEPDDWVWEIESMRGLFNAFDYQYWAVAQSIKYDFHDPKASISNQWAPASWLCDMDYILSGHTCSTGAALENGTQWAVTPKNIVIDHCLSTSTTEQCTLQYSLVVLGIIMACELTKLGSMVSTLQLTLKRKDQFSWNDTFATVGDATASFLTWPDLTSKSKCLVNLKEREHHIECTDGKCRVGAQAESNENRARRIPSRDYNDYRTDSGLIACQSKGCPQLSSSCPSPWLATKGKWGGIPSRSRWTVFFLLYLLVLTAAAVILSIGTKNLRGLNLAAMYKQGLGTVNPNFIFASYTAGNESGLLKDIILVNMPQLLLSVLYFLYNGMFTCMLAGREWAFFGSQRRTLRVSRPRGQQRSTYWLQLPWRYSISLVILSSLTHWLVGPIPDKQPRTDALKPGQNKVAKFTASAEPEAENLTLRYARHEQCNEVFSITHTLGEEYRWHSREMESGGVQSAESQAQSGGQ